ncbi:HIT family protein [Planktomarina temperata]|nr:HIT family protein [Planktomarina temperata]
MYSLYRGQVNFKRADHFAKFNAIHQMITKQRQSILDQDPTVTGFNVGINVGASAGQTVFHVHVHLIPRRDYDVVDP